MVDGHFHCKIIDRYSFLWYEFYFCQVKTVIMRQHEGVNVRIIIVWMKALYCFVIVTLGAQVTSLTENIKEFAAFQAILHCMSSTLKWLVLKYLHISMTWWGELHPNHWHPGSSISAMVPYWLPVCHPLKRPTAIIYIVITSPRPLQFSPIHADEMIKQCFETTNPTSITLHLK